MESMVRLGDYIEPVTRRNTELKYGVDDVMGITNTKVLMPTKARSEYADLSKFYILEPGEFIYNPRTSRNGEKVGMAYNNTDHNILFTFNNNPFRVRESKKNDLDSDYLYLFFLNPEFDRYARYNSWGSATELFTWEDMCDTLIKLPSLEEQQKIVRQYKTITDRIGVLEKINEELTELCKVQLKEYKSIVENAKSTSFIPIRDLVESNTANYSSKDKFEEIIYLDTGSITDNYVSETQIICPKKETVPSRCKRKVKSRDIIFSTVRPGNRHFGILYNPEENYIVSTGFSVLSISQDRISSEFIYMWLTSDEILSDLNEIAELSVTTYPSISNDDLMDVVIEVPDDYDFTKLNEILYSSMLTIDENSKELRRLRK